MDICSALVWRFTYLSVLSGLLVYCENQAVAWTNTGRLFISVIRSPITLGKVSDNALFSQDKSLVTMLKQAFSPAESDE
jgi:hypothetical protein